MISAFYMMLYLLNINSIPYFIEQEESFTEDAVRENFLINFRVKEKYSLTKMAKSIENL